jgi:DnaJ-class molecular chaperone
VRGLVQEATEKFQSLQRVFQVLSDPQRRAVYDQTGSLADSEELAGKDFNTLYEYYRDLYKKVRPARTRMQPPAHVGCHVRCRLMHV